MLRSSHDACGCSTQTTSTINLKRSTLHPHEGHADRPNTPSASVNLGSNPGKAFDIGGALRSYPVGNMAPGLAAMTGIRLPHHGKDARNRTWIQFLRMR